jgi:predicted N-acetyltransferase YhbS
VEQVRVHGAFSIERATPQDFADLVALRHLEDWAPNAWLFSAVEASGLGNMLVARWLDGVQDGGQNGHRASHTVAASAVATAYGAYGVIGNVIVHASHRARGLGRAVMEAELTWLRQRGVTHVELDATEHGRPLYEKLGFVSRAPSWMLLETVGRVREQRSTDESGIRIHKLTPATLECVAALDRQAFGGDRLPLLAAVLALQETCGWVATDAHGTAVGYLFARPTEHVTHGMRIGPWIARAPHVALSLMQHAVRAAPAVHESAPLVASVPGASEVVTGCFTTAGMALVPDDVRMRLTFPRDEGAAAIVSEAARADWVYGMLAPMVG